MLHLDDDCLSAERYDSALQDASQAVDLCSLSTADEMVEIRAKAYHRKAQILMHVKDRVKALDVYREGLQACPDKLELKAAARLALDEMPPSWIAAYWSSRVRKAEEPNPLSTRDGMLLRNIPRSKKLSDDEFVKVLSHVLAEQPIVLEECKDMIVLSWSNKGGPAVQKCDCALIRAVVYLEKGHSEQCRRDATVALVYGPHDADGAAWAFAYYMRAISYEMEGINVASLLDILQAIERSREPVPEEFQTMMERLLPRIPEHYAQAVRAGCGYKGLHRMMEVEQERSLPEFKKNRPKYYYYYEWMRRRIEERHPNISGPVMDKLLTLDATELDLLLQYPTAIDNTVEDLENVLSEKGGATLETYDVPLLTWEQVQELKDKTPPQIASSSHQLHIESA